MCTIDTPISQYIYEKYRKRVDKTPYVAEKINRFHRTVEAGK